MNVAAAHELGPSVRSSGAPRRAKCPGHRCRSDRRALERGVTIAGQGNRWRLQVGRWRVLIRLDNDFDTMLVLRELPRNRDYC